MKAAEKRENLVVWRAQQLAKFLAKSVTAEAPYIVVVEAPDSEHLNAYWNADGSALGRVVATFTATGQFVPEVQA